MNDSFSSLKTSSSKFWFFSSRLIHTPDVNRKMYPAPNVVAYNRVVTGEGIGKRSNRPLPKNRRIPAVK